jgi:hypothetical protein
MKDRWEVEMTCEQCGHNTPFYVSIDTGDEAPQNDPIENYLPRAKEIAELEALLDRLEHRLGQSTSQGITIHIHGELDAAEFERQLTKALRRHRFKW